MRVAQARGAVWQLSRCLRQPASSSSRSGAPTAAMSPLPPPQRRGCRQLQASAHAEPSSSEWSVEGAGSRQEWQRADLQVVLVHPQIPQNAGNVSRTCAATSVALHLVAPLGFEIDDRKLKRAGLDYWHFVAVCVHPSWEAFHAFYQQQPGAKQLLGFSKFGKQHYAAEGLYRPATSHWLMFGAETTGLPPEAHAAADAIVKIPMSERHVRSINLAVSVGVGVYEAIRQLDGAVLPEEQQGWNPLEGPASSGGEQAAAVVASGSGQQEARQHEGQQQHAALQ